MPQPHPFFKMTHAIPPKEFGVALLFHFLFFIFLTFRFHNIAVNQPITLSFLGSILDPFEVERVSDIDSPSIALPDILSQHGHDRSRKDVTAPEKPSLTEYVSTPLQPNYPSLPADTLFEEKHPSRNQPIQQPVKRTESQQYQHLKLYP